MGQGLQFVLKIVETGDCIRYNTFIFLMKGLVLDMGYVTVKFLGEEYQVSETINEFLDYDKILTPIRTTVLNMITADVKRDSNLVWEADTITEHVDGTANKYKKTIEDGAELLVKKLLALGIYEVTSNDLLKNVTSIGDINSLERNTFDTLLEEGRRFVNMQNAGIERAYNYAASNITGSGVRVFTSSFSTLMIHSAVERSILLSQAKKADQEYEKAVRTISSQTAFALDKLYRKVMIEKFYPSIMQIFLEFDNAVMSAFLAELTNHGKFDFESIEKYSMKKAEDMLKNITQVPDKIGFLKQTFLTCPFGLDVYEECLKQGLFDKDTFETAKYFGMGEELAEKMNGYINNNLENSDRIKPIISILASYQRTNELAIWRNLYKELLEKIQDTYKVYNSAIHDKKKLDSFIRQNIIHQISEIVDKSKEDINKSIDKKMNALVSEKQYNEFVGMGILSPETIRMSNSSATTLSDINNEIRSALAERIMEYIEEAKKRLDAYNKAKDLFDKELKQKEDELNALKSEREKLGLFAFSKKKEMSTAIENKASEISDFKRIHTPNDLWQDFERMYR